MDLVYKRKNILVTGCYHSLNSGVMAMAESIVQQHCNDDIFIVSSPRSFKLDEERYSLYNNVTLIIPEWYNGGSLRRKLVALTGLITGYYPKSLTKDIFNSIHIAYDISGDSISSDYGTVSTLLSLMPIKITSRYAEKSIVAPQSLGPFRSLVVRWFVNHTFKKVSKVYLRESVSEQYVQGLNFNYEIVADLGNLVVPSPISHDLVNQIDENFIGIGVSALLSKFGQGNSMEFFKNIIDKVLSSGKKVYLINHVNYETSNDLKFAEQIKNKFYKNNDDVIFFGVNFRASEWKGLFQRSAGVISARMHPTVLSLSAGRPALNISYNHKSQGVIQEAYSPYGVVVDFASLLSRNTHIEDFLALIENYNQKGLTEKIESNSNLARRVFE